MRTVRQTPPAITAVVIQCASLGFLALILFALWKTVNLQLSLIEIVLLQAMLTLLLTRWCKLAWWWCVIQPVFPIAIVFMLTWSLPPLFYFLIFFFLLVFYWSTFRTQVPYYPTTKKIWMTVEKLLPATCPISFIDVGSGLGGLVVYLAQKKPKSRFVGVEIAPLLWLMSYLRTVKRSCNAQFIRGDYEKINFAQFDVVFAYLSPAAMPNLWNKAQQEMLPGSILISVEFPVAGVPADDCICLQTGQPTIEQNTEQNTEQNKTNLYLWRM